MAPLRYSPMHDMIKAFGLFTLLIFISCQKSNLVVKKDDQGRISEEYNIDADSLKHGEFTSYINGVLVEKSNYEKGVLQGLRRLYHTNGQVEIEEIYDKGQIVDVYKVYFHDGTLAQEAQYENGMMQGMIRSYHKDGSIKEEVTMVANEENGPFKEYHPNGNLEWEGTYLDGDNEYGLLLNYNEQGELIKKMMCDSMARCTTIWTVDKGDLPLQKN